MSQQFNEEQQQKGANVVPTIIPLFYLYTTTIQLLYPFYTSFSENSEMGKAYAHNMKHCP